ncbi:MAG: PAS domain S-box protein [Alphaproteobacteria bacterium]|nr:MAG: PAS domain S-box protein [Alphaproteobacteria bacterium]
MLPQLIGGFIMTGQQIRGFSLVSFLILSLGIWALCTSGRAQALELASSEIESTEKKVKAFLDLIFESRDLDLYAYRPLKLTSEHSPLPAQMNLEILHSQADEYWYADDFDNLNEAANKLRETALQTSDEEHLAIADAYIAYAIGGMGDYAAAELQLNDVIARAEAMQDKTALVIATILRATLEPHEARFHQAKARIVTVSRLLDQTSETQRLKPAISYSLGYLSVELGDIDEAIYQYTQCIEEARLADEKIDLGTIVYNTAMALSEKGHVEASNNLFQRLIEWYEETGQPENRLYAYYGLAYNYYDLGEFAESLAYANAGLEVSKDQNDFTVFLRQVGAIGAARTGDIETAREYQAIAREYFDKRPEYSGTTWAARNQHVDAEIAFAEHRYKEAYKLIKKYYAEREEIIGEQNQADAKNWREQIEQAYQKIVADQEAKLDQQSKIQILQGGLILCGFFLFAILSVGFVRLKRTTVRLAESEARFDRAISNSKSGIWEYDLKAGTRFFSPSMEEIFGFEPSELVMQKNWKKIVFPPESLELISTRIEDLENVDDHFDFDVLAIRKDQQEIWVNVEGSVVRDAKGRVEAITGVTTDITDRKLAEHYLTEARNESDRLSRAKSEFIASMSHELRTPLNSVIGFSEVLRSDTRDLLTPRQMENVGYIEKAGKHLLNIVNSIINISRIELGECDLVFENVDMVEVVDDCCSMVFPMAAECQVSVHNHAQAPTQGVVLGDRQWIRQVLLNLLSNAIKYNVPGGKVSIELAMDDDHHCLISITDTGIGIDTSKQPHLFELFNRLGVEQFSSAAGSGIGLAVSKRMIEAMNGSISFESRINTGSRFWIRLPLARDGMLGDADTEVSAA